MRISPVSVPAEDRGNQGMTMICFIQPQRAQRVHCSPNLCALCGFIHYSDAQLQFTGEGFLANGIKEFIALFS